MDLSSFNLYLKSRNYSDSTVRNYLVDVRRFLESKLEPQEYLQSISLDPNFKRYYSALKIFHKFATDQNLIFKLPTQVTTPTDHLSAFKKHLEKKNTPISTIRNYINDVTQYISWLNTFEN